MRYPIGERDWRARTAPAGAASCLLAKWVVELLKRGSVDGMKAWAEGPGAASATAIVSGKAGCRDETVAAWASSL